MVALLNQLKEKDEEHLLYFVYRNPESMFRLVSTVGELYVEPSSNQVAGGRAESRPYFKKMSQDVLNAQPDSFLLL